MKPPCPILFEKDCPHCKRDSFALKHILWENNFFYIVCDVHPLTKGHILIIPKSHLSCIGAFPQIFFTEFEKQYQKVKNFLIKSYGNYALFEHGVIGQTVFHCHLQCFPFSGRISDIVPEADKYREIKKINDLISEYHVHGCYLFVEVENKLFLVNRGIGKPGFFRDRFATYFGHPERGNWKKAKDNQQLKKLFIKDILSLRSSWLQYNTLGNN